MSWNEQSMGVCSSMTRQAGTSGDLPWNISHRSTEELEVREMAIELRGSDLCVLISATDPCRYPS